MFTPAHIPQARLAGVGQVLPDPGWHAAAAHHLHHELIVVMAGGITVASGGVRLQAGPGSVLLYPADVEHEEWSDRAHPLHSIFFSFTAPGLDGQPVTVIPDNRQVVREIAARLYADRDTSSPAARQQRHAFLQVILAELLRNLGSEDRPMVTNVRRHIRAHIGERLTLERLAAVCGLSKFHFLRLYRAATGRTPMQDVRAMRAEYARELILATPAPLKEIAAQAGLGDEYALSRTFRHCFNTPPGRYRRSRVRKRGWG